MRKLISIKPVDEILPIPDADFLEVARIGGWKCVVKKGELKVGGDAVYVEIDSLVPVSHPAFAFLEPKKILWKGIEGARIKTIKLKGQVSQGLALSLNSFTEDEVNILRAVDNQPEGVDAEYISALGVVKWEPYSAEEQAKLGGATKGNWPYFLQKTDQERVQNYWNAFGNKDDKYVVTYTNQETGELITVERPFKYIRDTDYEVTIKLDGSSMTAFVNEGEFGLCSRNLQVKEDSDLAFATEARGLGLKQLLLNYHEKTKRNIALQGELIGPGIQGNNEKLPCLQFRLFDIYDIDKRSYVNAYERNTILDDLYTADHIDSPRILVAPLLEVRHFDFKTIEEALEYADGPSLNPNVKREGVVFKSIEDPTFSFKIISNQYLLKNGDRA